MAGLLTDSHLEAFPAKASGNEVFQDVIGASQQRDCPGFSPDSLLIFTKNIRFRTDFNRKDILFFINGKPNTFFYRFFKIVYIKNRELCQNESFDAAPFKVCQN